VQQVSSRVPRLDRCRVNCRNWYSWCSQDTGLNSLGVVYRYKRCTARIVWCTGTGTAGVQQRCWTL
jgi:hypothetical protein